MPAKCAWVGKQKPQEEQKDGGGFVMGKDGLLTPVTMQDG